MTLAWILFAVYVVATLVLAWLGSRQTKSLESYALGNRRMNPWVVGMALAASMTSTATLVINPGIVYAYGISAFLGYGVAAALGLTVGIVVLSKGFRRYGVKSGALTLPAWIADRYGSRGLGLFYACVNLLLIAMVVMICYAMAGVMVATLDLGTLLGENAFAVALLAVILFVFAYTLFGGTFAHAYTNTVQGGIMLVVALMLVFSGAEYWGDGFFDKLAAIDPVLAAPVNPGSLLFRNFFEVFVANLAVGLALAVQPHFVIKSLYVKSDRDVNIYLTVAIVCGVLFNLVMLCGFYARLGPSAEIEAFARASGLGIDGIMPAYVVQTFSPAVGAIVSIALLAAGMSTLDGILVATSAIFANDVVLALRRGRGTSTAATDLALGFRAGRYSLIVLGVVSFVLGLMQHRSKEFSIAIFAQEGIYALFSATFAPVLLGMFAKRPPPGGIALASSIAALTVHFGMRYGKLSLVTSADWTNPGLTATFALAASVVVVLGWFAFDQVRGGGAS